MRDSTITASAWPRLSARGFAVPILFAALISIGGYLRIPIPGTPVPLTMQVIFVLLAGAFQTPPAAAASVLLFLGAGLAGAPVFSGGGAGVAYLLGPTGGYLAGFVVGAWLCSVMLRGRRDSAPRTALAMCAALCVIHLLGALHLSLYLGASFASALSMGVLPFLPLDLLKVAAAAAFVTGCSALSQKR